MQYENIYNKLLPNGEKGYDGAVTIGDRAQAAFDGQFESIWGNKEKNIRGKVGEAYDKALQNLKESIQAVNLEVKNKTLVQNAEQMKQLQCHYPEWDLILLLLHMMALEN